MNLTNSSRFIDDLVEEDTEVHTDGTKSYPEKLRPRQKVNHSRNIMARDNPNGGPRISTNLDENFWSTFQELLDRRRAVTATYLPLYLAEHLWRYNHGSEPTLEQLRAFIRNAHDVVLRGDDKPLPATHGRLRRYWPYNSPCGRQISKNKKARNKKQRSRSKGKKGSIQQRMEGM